VRRLRDQVVPLAAGHVLEVGVGTGLNLRHYDRSKITSVTGLDPAVHLQERARRRGRRAGIDLDFVGLPAERFEAADARFDTVLMTYTLCSLENPMTSLGVMRRALRPEGRLVFCEHGRAPDPGVSRWQMRLTPVWRKVAGGCHLDRDVLALLREGGFACREPRTLYLPGPRPFTYTTWGIATPA